MLIFSFIFSFHWTDNKLIPTEVRKDALELQKLLEYDDEGAEGKQNRLMLNVRINVSYIKM